jgi:hypothetical protein
LYLLFVKLSEQSILAETFLKESVLQRPQDYKEMKQLINKIRMSKEANVDSFTTFDQDDDQDLENENASGNEDDEVEDPEEDAGKKKSIKSQSPFTKHFENIKVKVEMSIAVESAAVEDESEDESTSASLPNEYHMPDVIGHLLNEYMPYCFIWAGLTLRGLGK